MVIAKSETATATADGLFTVVAVVAVVESKGVEEAQFPLPKTLDTVAERLGKVDMIGVSPTMANVGMFSEETMLFGFKNLSF